jgi:hypothetical protein
VADFVASVATPPDAQASAMLKEAQEIDEGRVKLRREYIARMTKALGPRQQLRFVQIDNKLDAVARADVSRQIPLAP